MNNQPEPISAERLIEAAEAILLAVTEIAETASGRYVEPTELLGSELQPQILCDFTREEVSQATVFLHRMGMLPAA
ncbi:MAG: hypothetical protein KF757_11370 [Phycisphaeraceae bacterium]|nr:hypothetical protein [Phycisphaeraceae bacterium]MCW5762286.1 hypothetical protein [Phycisphaeraceae bacterium]